MMATLRKSLRVVFMVGSARASRLSRVERVLYGRLVTLAKYRICEGAFMDLYLIRHAAAAEAGPDGNDVVRPLTDLGHRQAKALAAALVKRGVTLNAIVTSPLIRAAQTTEHLMAGLPEPHPPLHVFDEIGY